MKSPTTRTTRATISNSHKREALDLLTLRTRSRSRHSSVPSVSRSRTTKVRFLPATVPVTCQQPAVGKVIAVTGIPDDRSRLESTR